MKCNDAAVELLQSFTTMRIPERYQHRSREVVSIRKIPDVHSDRVQGRRKWKENEANRTTKEWLPRRGRIGPTFHHIAEVRALYVLQQRIRLNLEDS